MANMIEPVSTYRGRKWPERLVSVAKGLMDAGFSARLVAKLLSVPICTVQDWQKLTRHQAVEPDGAVLERVRRVILE